MTEIATAIITNNTEYLREAALSCDTDLFIFYDGVGQEGISEATEFQVDYKFPSMSRNFALSKLSDYEFVQFLDSDDYLSSEYIETALPIIRANPEFDIFYTDYKVDLVELGFTYEEHLFSLNSKNTNNIAPRIKNPLIRRSNLKFDEKLQCFEWVDYIFKSGIYSTYHIPISLQTVRHHSKSHERLLPSSAHSESMRIINEGMRAING